MVLYLMGLVLPPFMGGLNTLAEVSQTSSQLEVDPNMGLVGGEAMTKGDYNKVFKYEVWCVLFCSLLLLGRVNGNLTTLYPNCDRVHEQQPMNSCCHPLWIEAACSNC